MQPLPHARQLLEAVAAEARDLAELLHQVEQARAVGRVPVEAALLDTLPAALTALRSSLRELADQVGNSVDPTQL